MNPTTDIYTLLDKAEKIDTVQAGGNGYPRGLRVAYKADTMAELRELHDAAVAQGHQVEVVSLHRRDGWHFWERTNSGHLDDDEWMGDTECDWIIMMMPESKALDKAFEIVCGTGYEPQDAADLLAKAKRVQELADELPDPDDLEEGERVLVYLDDYHQIKFAVRTGQNGYYYDTHHYCSALIITEREEDDNGDDQ